MKALDRVILDMVEVVERRVTSPIGIAGNIMSRQKKIVDPFQFGSIAALTKLHNVIGMPTTQNIAETFSPKSIIGMDTLSKMDDIGNVNQSIPSPITLSEGVQEALLSVAFKSSTLVSAINVGKVLERNFESIMTEKAFNFLEKMRPQSLPLDNLKLFNQQYTVGEKGIINPFIETNRNFFNILDLRDLDRHVGLESFFGSIKSLEGNVGEELTTVLKEVTGFDSDTDNYIELISTLNEQVDELKARVEAMDSISPEEKKLIPSVLMLVLNFAKANGISLISVALAIYLSYGTDHNVDMKMEEVKKEIRASSSQIEQNQEAITRAIGTADHKCSIYKENLNEGIESLERDFIKIENKMQQVINKVDSL